MGVSQAIQRICEADGDAITPGERRRSLTSLAAIVAVALSVHLASRLFGPAALPVDVGAQLALPFVVAWSVRRFTGPAIFAAAAVMALGLAAPMFILEPEVWTRSSTANAFVAAGMLWILAIERRASAGLLVGGSAILGAAFALAALI